MLFVTSAEKVLKQQFIRMNFVSTHVKLVWKRHGERRNNMINLDTDEKISEALVGKRIESVGSISKHGLEITLDDGNVFCVDSAWGYDNCFLVIYLEEDDD
jgi:hypothetical protein